MIEAWGQVIAFRSSDVGFGPSLGLSADRFHPFVVVAISRGRRRCRIHTRSGASEYFGRCPIDTKRCELGWRIEAQQFCRLSDQVDFPTEHHTNEKRGGVWWCCVINLSRIGRDRRKCLDVEQFCYDFWGCSHDRWICHEIVSHRTRSIRTAQKRVRCQLYLCSLRCTPCAQSNLWIVSVLQDVNFLRKRLLCRCGGTRIEFNRAVERGGGLYVLTTSNSYAKRTGLWIRRVTVSHNEANRGGGIFASFAEIELPDGSDGVFLLRKNVAGDLKRGGGGGGMVLENSHLVRLPVQFGTQCRA